MIKEIIDSLIAQLPKSVDTVKTADRYRGEFEENSEWNPVFPSVFFQVNEFKPEGLMSDGRTVKKRVFLTVYCANEYEAAELAESVYDFLDGIAVMDESGVYRNMSCTGGKLHGWFQRVEVYKIEVTII